MRYVADTSADTCGWLWTEGPSERHVLPMTIAPRDLTPVDHRKLAVDLFNHVWRLLDHPDRTPVEDDELIHAAHASCHHWSRAEIPPDPVRLITGEWQCSRVYSMLGRAEPARWHATRARKGCEAAGIDGFLLGAAYEALARASRVAGERAETEHWIALGRRIADELPDPEDRQVLTDDLEEIALQLNGAGSVDRPEGARV